MIEKQWYWFSATFVVDSRIRISSVKESKLYPDGVKHNKKLTINVDKTT